MSTSADKSMDELVATARLGGQIDTLIELKQWIDTKLKAANQENEARWKEIYEHDVRTTSAAAN